ncbi:MAG: hypothetical protein SFZ03_05485 [Candidatus Melainabacteria bacterium]|nr:hypothetical protein [Candidatus Melainabacteria bacterium]
MDLNAILKTPTASTGLNSINLLDSNTWAAGWPAWFGPGKPSSDTFAKILGGTANANGLQPPTPPDLTSMTDSGQIAAAQSQYNQELLSYQQRFLAYHQRMVQLMMQRIQELQAAQQQQNNTNRPNSDPEVGGIGGILEGVASADSLL